jgi:hypothetical protein
MTHEPSAPPPATPEAMSLPVRLWRRRAVRLATKGTLAVLAVYVLTAYTLCGLPDDVVDVLRHAERYELLSLDGRVFGPAAAATGERLHDRYPVLGRVRVDDPADRAALFDALQSSSRWGLNVPALCFDPHHAIRATRDGHTTDVLVCFACFQAQVWQDGKQVGGFTIGRSPRGTFDAVLRKAGVPLAPER